MVLKALYWLAVLAVSVVLLVLLMRFFESRDDSKIGAAADAAAQMRPSSVDG